MVVLKVQVTDFVFFDAEGQPPVRRDVQTPDAPAVADQPVGFPHRDRSQFVFAFHVLQEAQHHTELVHGRGRHALRAVFRVKAFDALVNDVPYLDMISVA